MKKECFKCGIEKNLSEFYKHKEMPDGTINKCKDCTKKDVRENYTKNIDHYKEYERRRAMLPHRVDARQKYQNTDSGKESLKKAKKKWIDNNQIKRAASIMVGNAVRDGKIIKPDNCESCGSAPKILHGHHDDYSEPLSVRWLCPGCHTKWHKENGEGLNAI